MPAPKAAQAAKRPPVTKATSEELAAQKAALEAYRKFAKLSGPQPWDQLLPE